MSINNYMNMLEDFYNTSIKNGLCNLEYKLVEKADAIEACRNETVTITRVLTYEGNKLQIEKGLKRRVVNHTIGFDDYKITETFGGNYEL